MIAPLIATVIPTYKRPAMLRRAIHSVLNQTFPDFRICIYDNASGDGTREVAEEFCRKDSRVEYVCRPDNIGAHANWMDAASRVGTPFFSFLPDDDILLPHFFETALAGFQRYPEAAMSILPTISMSPGGLVLYAYVRQWPEGLLMPPSGMLCILRYGNPSLPSMLIRRAVWEEFEGFDEATEPCADFDFELRVTARLPVVVSRQPGAIQVMHNEAQTAAGGLNWSWPCLPRIIDKITKDANLPSTAREDAVEALTNLMKRSLVLRGVIRSIIRGKWEEAEEAGNILLQACGRARSAEAIPIATAVCRKLPGIRLSLRALVALRTYVGATCNLDLQWRLRSYSRFLRDTAAETLQPLL